MACVICGASGYDGAMNTRGEEVCIDCWANGEAAVRGMVAEAFVPARTSYHVTYPPEMQRGFIDACNQHLEDEEGEENR